MIFPKSKEESAEWKKNVEKNREAGDWINTDLPNSVLPTPLPNPVEEILQRVGGARLPLKK